LGSFLFLPTEWLGRHALDPRTKAATRGISSALAAPAAVGIPVTKRGVASSVAITTAQGAGSRDRLADLARSADTVVLVALVLGRAVGGSRPASVIGNATLSTQRSVSGTQDCIARCR
jgi:siroheme synthase